MDSVIRDSHCLRQFSVDSLYQIENMEREAHCFGAMRLKRQSKLYLLLSFNGKDLITEVSVPLSMTVELWLETC